MADFFIYQPIDMLNEDHLGGSSSTSRVVSTTGWDKIDKNGYQTVTQQLSTGFTKVAKYHSPGLDGLKMYEYSIELKGRYTLENFKISYNEWLAIYGRERKYSDIDHVEWGDINNTGRSLPEDEVEIFAKILEGSDNITGSGGGDYLYSFRGDDLVNPGGGDDYVNGGSGIDTVEYSGKRSQYTLAKATDPSGIQSVTDYSDPNSLQVIYLASVDRAFKVSGPDGNDTLVDVEKLKFTDGTYNIATGAFTEEDNSSSSGNSKGGKSKKPRLGKGKRNKR